MPSTAPQRERNRKRAMNFPQRRPNPNGTIRMARSTPKKAITPLTRDVEKMVREMRAKGWNAEHIRTVVRGRLGK